MSGWKKWYGIVALADLPEEKRPRFAVMADAEVLFNKDYLQDAGDSKLILRSLYQRIQNNFDSKKFLKVSKLQVFEKKYHESQSYLQLEWC